MRKYLAVDSVKQPQEIVNQAYYNEIINHTQFFASRKNRPYPQIVGNQCCPAEIT